MVRRLPAPSAALTASSEARASCARRGIDPPARVRQSSSTAFFMAGELCRVGAGLSTRLRPPPPRLRRGFGGQAHPRGLQDQNDLTGPCFFLPPFFLVAFFFAPPFFLAITPSSRCTTEIYKTKKPAAPARPARPPARAPSSSAARVVPCVSVCTRQA